MWVRSVVHHLTPYVSDIINKKIIKNNNHTTTTTIIINPFTSMYKYTYMTEVCFPWVATNV